MEKEAEIIKQIFSKERIDNKKECYLLYQNNIFGNKVLTWNSFEEIIKSGWKDKICIRSRKGTARANVKYNVSLYEAPKLIKCLIQEGVKEQDMSFNQSMPDNHLTIQGEITLTEKGLYVLYSEIKKPMNLALKEESKHAFGLKAINLLKSNIDPSSLSDIYALLDYFPDSVIEFSSYCINVGSIPGRNTVFWEVRNY